MAHRVLIVGRGRGSDVQVDNPSVSRLHAELVVTDDGAFHITDRLSTNGTWIRVAGAWQPVRQRWASARDRLRLGDFEVSVEELVRRAGDGRGRPAGPPPPPPDGLPPAKVRRHSETGNVVEDVPGP